MNSLNISLPYDYVTNLINLTWSDLLFAVEQGYMSREAAVEHAINIVGKEKEKTHQKVLELACLTNEESNFWYIDELLNQIYEQDGSSSRDKFLFLLLNWIFEHKELYLDPLEMVENIYADFNYPEKISEFVRYMPSKRTITSLVKLNTAYLYNRWKEFLEQERVKYFLAE
ncbi:MULTISPECIES: DUF2247 family protein [unclassified Paenibacillus]|uniref:DUF2247 family protein n=1 Tax=unclassified Paenibacillus TaxID=185978 RepID=UPI00020D769B|nr:MULTISPECIES: DUF2247 family protein [unclassified Paenibacillus]EGL19879.1 hypothetical protein HMPREF9413_3294 [Paenibacillus sp. HGF7]EPD88610.1 hypothetical protein HMPREF1207_02039 [Paenibacillus sp. HGH0039]